MICLPLFLSVYNFNKKKTDQDLYCLGLLLI